MPETVSVPLQQANALPDPGSLQHRSAVGSAHGSPPENPGLLSQIAAMALSLAEGWSVRVAIVADDRTFGTTLEEYVRSLAGFTLVGSFRWTDLAGMAAQGSGVDLLVAGPAAKGNGKLPSDAGFAGGFLGLVLAVGILPENLPRELRESVLKYAPKPSDPEAIRKCLEGVREAVVRRREERVVEKLRPLVAAAADAVPHPERILVKSSNRLTFLRISEVDWIEAQGDYVCIHSRQKKHLIREKISAIEGQLPRGRFARIHRSTIVNLDRVKEMQPLFYGEYAVILEDGTRLTMSRSFREKVFQSLCAAS